MELDEFLCLQYPDCNKGFIRQQVRDGMVLVDGMPAKPSQRLRPEQVLMVEFEDAAPLVPVAPDVEIPVIRETEDWLVVDKPAGLAVEPERWAREAASLSGALLQLARDRSDGSGALSFRLRVVHRIDKDTSGVVLVAKNIEAERFLRQAFEKGRVTKRYSALVEGEVPLADGEVQVIDLPVGPDDRKSGRMVVRADGKPSRTRISVVTRFRGYTLLSCEPLTGRTHQIRVHLAHEGFPLAVDSTYGRRDVFFLSGIKASYKQKPGRPERPLMSRLTLHARELGIPAMDGGETVWVEAPLPKDFLRVLKQLDKVRSWQR